MKQYHSEKDNILRNRNSIEDNIYTPEYSQKEFVNRIVDNNNYIPKSAE